MKKLLGIFFLIVTTVFFTGCDNNDGPFQIKNENGRKILYSGKKPAKGWVEYTVYNKNDTTTKIYEIEFKEGNPSGDFSLYSLKGEKIFEGKGKWKDGMFNGKIQSRNIYGKNVYGEGKFKFSSSNLLDYPVYLNKRIPYMLVNNFLGTLYDGKVEDDGNLIIMKDGKKVQKKIRYTNGYRGINKYDDDGILIDSAMYNEQGKLFKKYYQEKEFWHVVEYDKNEQVKSHEVYKGTSVKHSYHHKIK